MDGPFKEIACPGPAVTRNVVPLAVEPLDDMIGPHDDRQKPCLRVVAADKGARCLAYAHGGRPAIRREDVEDPEAVDMKSLK